MEERVVSPVRELPADRLVRERAVLPREDADAEVAVLRLPGRERDRPDVDRERARRAVAASTREPVGLAAEVEGGVCPAAEGAVRDAPGRADPGRTAFAGRRLRGQGKRGERR